MKKAVTIIVAIVAAFGFTILPAMAQQPVIALERVDVAAIQPFFAKPKVDYKSEKEPGKDLAVGAMLSLGYVLTIKNPGKAPVMLDELSFTTSFDGFEVATPMVYDDQWIPGGKTNELRVVVTSETLPTIGNLSVGTGNVARMQEMKTTAGALVKKWWDNAGDFSFPIEVTNGTALFKDEKGKEIRVTFTGKWPKK
jgi:hypothetical protein